VKIEHIPVTHHNIQIGTASISEDGSILMALETDEAKEFGELLIGSIKRGHVTGLSISPVIPPAVPAKVHIHMNNPGPGFQFGHGNTQVNHF
jgi:hypothetical protein